MFFIRNKVNNNNNSTNNSVELNDMAWIVLPHSPLYHCWASNYKCKIYVKMDTD